MSTSTHCNTLQHTATHCNTLQYTATHCNTLRYQHCKTDIARNTSQQNSSKSVCAAMKATLLHNVVSRCMHKCCDACVAISMHVLQYRMTHRMHTRPQNTRNLNVARRTLQEIHGSKTPRGRCVQCNPKVHAWILQCMCCSIRLEQDTTHIATHTSQHTTHIATQFTQSQRRQRLDTCTGALVTTQICLTRPHARKFGTKPLV